MWENSLHSNTIMCDELYLHDGRASLQGIRKNSNDHVILDGVAVSSLESLVETLIVPLESQKGFGLSLEAGMMRVILVVATRRVFAAGFAGV